MRLIIAILCLVQTSFVFAQNDIGFIAPEGKILNYRTLVWSDFMGKEDKEFANELEKNNTYALAYVCPAIYFKADSGERLDNGRVKFKFHTKCAFQSRAFVRESTKEMNTDYVLTHEQDHYDIALTYANKLQADLSAKDYSEGNYNEEIDKIYEDLLKKHRETQKTYDGEVNPGGASFDVPKQTLWDMRIKKGLDMNTVDFYTSPESAVVSVKGLGQLVKRIPGEPPLQFVVRARPLYWQMPEDMMNKVKETTEWTPEPSVISYFTQRYFTEVEGEKPKENFRTIGYIYLAQANGMYKRTMIDTFLNEGRPVKITATFFANADSDAAKELIIVAASDQKDRQANGTKYMIKVFDDIGNTRPGKLRRLDDVIAKLPSGFEGVNAGKPSKAPYKNEKEITEALRKMGYN